VRERKETMDADVLKSSAQDHMDVMTMMMQMEKFPEFFDLFHNTPAYQSLIYMIVEDNVSILQVGHLLCFSSHKQSITEYIYGQCRNGHFLPVDCEMEFHFFFAG
jgi:hypothetical protein